MVESYRDDPMSIEILITRNIDRMILAKAGERKWEYWVFFSSVAKLMASHIPIKIRSQMEEEYINMDKQIKININNKALNTTTRQDMNLGLRWDYADKFEFVLNKGLSASGLLKNKDEGEVDVENIDIDTMAHIIRSDSIWKAEKEKAGLVKSNDIHL